MRLSLLNEISRDDVEFKRKFDTDEVVDVNLAKFDQAWSQDIGYIGKGGVGGIKDRYKEFLKFLKQGHEIEMPEVSLSDNNIPVFTNGRHRTAVFRDLGFTEIPMAVPADQTERFIKLFG